MVAEHFWDLNRHRSDLYTMLEQKTKTNAKTKTVNNRKSLIFPILYNYNILIRSILILFAIILTSILSCDEKCSGHTTFVFCLKKDRDVDNVIPALH